MKIIYNNFIPFSGYRFANLFGVLFIKDKSLKLSDEDLNHENIHTKQMKYLLYIFFYLFYYIEYILKIPIALFYNPTNFNTLRYAYRSISFEQEAYYNQNNLKYLDNMNPYAWTKYIFKMYQ